MEFDYNELWNEQSKEEMKRIDKEIIPNLPMGKPRKGVNIIKRFRVKK